jgi:membrane-associated protease RseP (regulator of RpoE activity)
LKEFHLIPKDKETKAYVYEVAPPLFGIFPVGASPLQEKTLIENNYRCQGVSIFHRDWNWDQLYAHAEKIQASKVVIATTKSPAGMDQGGKLVFNYTVYASFWNKYAKTPVLGIYFRNLTDEEKFRVESNKGVFITNIVKQSPAYNANLLVGDIIFKINNKEIFDDYYLKNLIMQNTKKTIDLEIIRKDKHINKVINLK